MQSSSRLIDEIESTVSQKVYCLLSVHVASTFIYVKSCFLTASMEFIFCQFRQTSVSYNIEVQRFWHLNVVSAVHD